MKRFYTAVLAFCIYLVSMVPLFSQEVCSSPNFLENEGAWADSVLVYSFNSEEDSLRSSIQIFQRSDSIYPDEFEWKGEWNVDSAKWIANSKYMRAWDQAGNEVLYTWAKWKGENGWEPMDSVWRDYDTNSMPLFMDTYRWNNTQLDWIGVRRNEYFRDGAGNDTLKQVSVWDLTTNDWRFSTMLKSRYDSENRKVEYLSSEWNSNDDVWIFIGGEQTEYILNVSGALETSIFYAVNMADTSWFPYSKAEYTLDDFGHMLGEEGYRLIDSVWVPKSNQEWAYDEAGNIILHTTYTWNYELDTLEYYRRSAYTFDSQGRKSSDETHVWDSDLEEWLLSRRITFTYNEDDNITIQENIRWIVQEGGEFSHSRTEYLYNSEGQDSVRIFYRWNEALQEFLLVEKAFYYYGEKKVIVNAEESWLQVAEFTVYPVPVRDLLLIKSVVPVRRVDLLDLNGRIVYSSDDTEGGMDLSSLESGIYLVRLKNSHGKLLGTKKILKE